MSTPAAADAPVLLSVEGLSKSFYATRAADDVTFAVGAGEIVSLLGENGAGKSTLIKMLAGVYKPDAGRVCCAAPTWTPASARKRISFIHQNLGLVDWMTVAENIALVLGYPRRAGLIDATAAPAPGRAGAGRCRRRHRPATPASSTCRAPSEACWPSRGRWSPTRLLLVLDEPTASLPADEVERLFAVLRRLRDTRRRDDLRLAPARRGVPHRRPRWSCCATARVVGGAAVAGPRTASWSG